MLPPTYVAPPPPGAFAGPPGFVPPPAASGWAQQPPSRPVYRGQAPDEPATPPDSAPRPMPLTLPSPEQLGVATALSADSPGIDWSAAHRRLDHLGAVCFRLEKLPQGGYRVSCLIPTPEPSRTHHVEAEAATEAEAVHLALDRAETVTAKR